MGKEDLTLPLIIPASSAVHLFVLASHSADQQLCFHLCAIRSCETLTHVLVPCSHECMWTCNLRGNVEFVLTVPGTHFTASSLGKLGAMGKTDRILSQW